MEPRKKLKILHTVETYFPSQNGMAEVVKQVSERLAKRGHHVVVATSSSKQRRKMIHNNVEIKPFWIFGKRSFCIFGTTSKYKNFLQNSKFDIITNFAAEHWASDLIFPYLDKLKAKKIFVPTGFPSINNLLFYQYYKKMKTWIKKYNAIVFLSKNQNDYKFAKKHFFGKQLVIPNGASTSEFCNKKKLEILKNNQHPKNKKIIHVSGYLSIAKGQLEAIQIFSQSNISNATLFLICPEFYEKNSFKNLCKKIARGIFWFFRGHGLRNLLLRTTIFSEINKYDKINKLYNREVKTLVLSRNETVSAFLEADLLLFPSWIECAPLVVYEAVASKTPFCISNVGNAKELVKKFQSGVLLPTKKCKSNLKNVNISKSVLVLNKIFLNKKKLDKKVLNSYKVWKKNFTWDIIANKYEYLYNHLLKS